MKKSILVSLAILTLSTSSALAWTHHSRAMHHPKASAAATNPNPYARPMNANAFAPVGAPGVSSKDHDMYMKNLHDSGYDPKNDFAGGKIKTQ
jgi:hypothetical protein